MSRAVTAASRAVVVQGRLQGSGVILNRRMVLTCAHVVGDEASGDGGSSSEHHGAPDRYEVVPYGAVVAAHRDGTPAPGAERVVTHPADAPPHRADGPDDPDAPDVTVVHPDAGPVPCSVLWRDHALDAAVLYATADLPFTMHIRIGRLDTDQPLPGCQIIGFPAVQRRSGRLASDQLRGTVLPAAGRPGTVLTFAFDQLPAASWYAGPHRTAEEPDILGTIPWHQVPDTLLAGLSGAPVFAGEVLLGIVTRIPRARFQLRAEGTAVADLTGLPYDLPQAEPISEHIATDIPYEAEYARAVEATYRRTKVFGLDDLNRRESEWDLDIAYLSLEAEPRHGTGAPDTAAKDPFTDFAAGLRPEHATRGGHLPQRIDTLLAGRPRVLLRGEAGAGKTTLVWWLAAHAAQGTLGPQLAELNGLVPFVVPLRSVRARNGTFPVPAELPRAARLMIDPPPDGWATRVLRAGRALLLVDGLDEVPRADREDAQQWLAALLERFPGTRCVATVRPLAVEAEWLADEEFEELRLLPMRDDDIHSFVVSWHRAALHDGDDTDELYELERDLLRQFQQNPALRDLARTPLLCAVICALHRKRQGFLPETRFQLYQSALAMLLGNRDERRRVGAPDGISMSVAEHHQILQRFAVWLVRCGQSELSRDQTAPLLESALSGMARVRQQGSADDVLTHLLNRSGLLQERGDDSFQFIHRTFQDFLAAKEFVEGGYLGELVRNAAEDQWRDVVLLAAGHCGRREIHELLAGLLGRAVQAERQQQRKLYVLAARCAEHAAWIDAEMTARIGRAMRRLVPGSLGDAEVLIEMGPSVLPFLPPPERLTDDQAWRLAYVICTVGGAEALPYARGLARRAGSDVTFQLAGEWDSFPAEEYARDVLSVLDLSRHDVVVTSARQLAQVHRLPRCRGITFQGDFSSAGLGTCTPPAPRVVVTQNSALTECSFLHDWNQHSDRLPGGRLERLNISKCPAVRDISALASALLDELLLHLPQLPVAALRPLGDVPGLRRLALLDLAVRRIKDVPTHPGVQDLYLRSARMIDLDGLDQWESLTSLSLISDSTKIHQLLAHVRDISRITRLETNPPSLSLLLDEPAVPHLHALVLRDTQDWTHLSELPRVFPALTDLTLDLDNEELAQIDLTPLAALPDVQVHTLGGRKYGIDL